MSNYVFTSSFSAIMPPPPPVSLICIKSLMAFWSPAIRWEKYTVKQGVCMGALRWLSVILRGISFPPPVYVTHQCCKHSSGCWVISRPHAGDTELPTPQWTRWPASHRWSWQQTKMGSFKISQQSQKSVHDKHASTYSADVLRLCSDVKTHLHLLKASMARFHSCSSNSTIPVRYAV